MHFPILKNNKTKLAYQRLEEISAVLEIPVNDLISFDDKQIINNTFKDTSKGFFNVNKVITEAFKNERKAYLKQIKYLKEEITYLKSKLDK